MATKETALALAAFLDSSAARGLDVAGPRVRTIAEAFFVSCYEELGKKPRLLDGEDAEALLARLLPARLDRDDPLAQDVPAVLEALLDHLETSEVVTQAFEARRGLERAAPAFFAAVRAADTPRHAPTPPDPFVHRASKLGRNDPCSCGSGKKYKKCHGKSA